MFALILSLSLGWAWPQVWIQGTSFLFLLNFDLWEFIKVQTVYTGQQQAFPDPAQLPFSYLGLSIAWILFIVLTAFLLGLFYQLIPRIPFFSPVYRLQLRARLVSWSILIAQALCLPFGLTLVRLFNCQNYPSGPNGQLSFQSVVLSDTQCWSGSHLGILIPMLVVAIAYFIVLPSWMIYVISKEVRTSCICTSKPITTHENLIRLKEAEYIEGLDIAWEIKHYSLFSSFKRPWIWFRPFSFFVKGILLIIYGSLFYVPYYQTILMFALVCLVLLVLFVFPGTVYRVFSFNFVLIFNISVNLVNLGLGLSLVLRVQSFFLTGLILTYLLVAVNVTWLIVTLGWFCYLIIRDLPCIKEKYGPLWPTLSELNWSNKRKSNNTLKYFQAILRGRQILEECYSAPTLFAPVHSLSKQIQTVNAYCSEAEVTDNVAHGLLRALLAQLVDVHNHIRPLSAFRASINDDVLPHIQYLTTLMPDFTKRLEQREYDLILTTPKKRRMLLKLFAVATFQGIARNCSKYRRNTDDPFDQFVRGKAPLDESEIVKRKPSVTSSTLNSSNKQYYDDEVGSEVPLISPSLASSFELNFPDSPSPSEVMPDSPPDQDKPVSKTGVRFKTLATITEQDMENRNNKKTY